MMFITKYTNVDKPTGMEVNPLNHYTGYDQDNLTNIRFENTDSTFFSDMLCLPLPNNIKRATWYIRVSAPRLKGC